MYIFVCVMSSNARLGLFNKKSPKMSTTTENKHLTPEKNDNGSPKTSSPLSIVHLNECLLLSR